MLCFLIDLQEQLTGLGRDNLGRGICNRILGLKLSKSARSKGKGMSKFCILTAQLHNFTNLNIFCVCSLTVLLSSYYSDPCNFIESICIISPSQILNQIWKISFDI